MVLSIFVVLFILSWPFLDRVRGRYDLEMAVWEIHSKMNHLKYLAIKDSVPYRLRIINPSYSVEKYEPLSSQWKKVEHKVFPHLNLEASNSPIFYPEGTVSNLASITISNAFGKYRLTLAISGRIKIIRLT
ncbi:MAG: hypothetical protein N3B16_03945 [Candidatus Aminicenantes bacterium]|nr:hypothetical protein [Candidatus Aminicenantes bacterium]